MTHPFAALEHPASPDKVEASLLRNDGSLILPRPRVSGGKPLMRALKERHTSREFARGQLPLQLLSDLLWAAFGVNRTSERGRTAPSAANWQEIDIHVALREGVYVFDAVRHALMFRLGEDVPARTKMQDFVTEAPLATPSFMVDAGSGLARRRARTRHGARRVCARATSCRRAP